MKQTKFTFDNVVSEVLKKKSYLLDEDIIPSNGWLLKLKKLNRVDLSCKYGDKNVRL